MSTGSNIDLSALAQQVSSEVEKMSTDDVRKQLATLRVREKLTQKKQYGSDAAKKSAAKLREKAKALKARAKALGIYDAVDEEAEEEAQEKFATWQAEQGQTEEADV